jgi:CheY-like chemotaxis protein
MTGAPPGSAPPGEVLVADDNPTNVFVLTAMLRAIGIATVSAADGAEAVEIAAARRPALIFMDVQMPRLDGMAAACRIRSEAAGRRVVIVAVTAFPDVRHLPDFRAAAFDDFLVKPFELSVVRRTVEKWASHGSDAGFAGTARA